MNFSNDIDISDIPLVWSFLKANCQSDPESFWRLSRQNKTPFTVFWGKGFYDKTENNWQWKFRSGGLNWLIITADSGSKYIIQPTGKDYNQDVKVASGALSFIKDLMVKLNEFDG
jgi:hypothetical protein